MIRVEELFALALRIIGLVLLFYGLQGLLDAALFKLGYFNFPDSSPGYYLISGLFCTVLGFYLVNGAPGLVSFAYRGNDEYEEDSEGDDYHVTDNEEDGGQSR
jgi:hypothetical protein